MEGLPAPDRFHDTRPKDLRGRQPPWHRLAYIIEKLPESLERLAGDLRVPAGGRVLDFGSAEAPYRYFFPATVEFVAADLPGNPSAQLIVQPDGTLPVDDDSFDAVLSTQVLEHVGDPAVYLREAFRVLKPGGRMLLSTHGFMVWHPDPVDYWRWTCSGLQEAVAQPGFRVVTFEGVMGLAASGLQLVQDAYYWKLPRKIRSLFALVIQSLIRLADRLEPAESKRLNALVFALIAEKPR